MGRALGGFHNLVQQQHNSAAAAVLQRHVHIFLSKGGVGVNKMEGKPEGRQKKRKEKSEEQ